MLSSRWEWIHDTIPKHATITFSIRNPLARSFGHIASFDHSHVSTTSMACIPSAHPILRSIVPYAPPLPSFCLVSNQFPPSTNSARKRNASIISQSIAPHTERERQYWKHFLNQPLLLENLLHYQMEKFSQFSTNTLRSDITLGDPFTGSKIGNLDILFSAMRNEIPWTILFRPRSVHLRRRGIRRHPRT